MSDTTQAVDDRTLYPDSNYSEYAPTGWVVYEVKNNHHVSFEHKVTEALVHAEADGILPIVSLFVNGDQELKRGEATWEDALVLARDIMAAYALGDPQPDDHIAVPESALTTLVDDAFTDITDGHYVGEHRTDIANALTAIYDVLGNDSAAEQTRQIAAEPEWGQTS